MLRSSPGVREAVVLAREDAAGGEAPGGLCGQLRARRWMWGSCASSCRRSLPEYMVPAAYVQLESLPLTANGKLDRRALPAPEGAAFAQREYEEPQGELESALAQIWSELLGVERVGRQDHFFELGGHSLLAVQLMARVRQRLGLEVSLQRLFAQPVLQQFAQLVSQAQRSELPPLQGMERPAACCRCPSRSSGCGSSRSWMRRPARPITSRCGLRLRGRLDQPALQRALDRIVERHEVLRTHFELLEGEAGAAHCRCECGLSSCGQHDLRGEPDREEQVRYWSQQEADAEFDLQHGPLIRGRLLQLAEQEHVLLVTMHHIVSDGWSLGIFTRELSALYRAFSQGEADPLAPLSIQYADYALWQRQWLSEPLQQQLMYWKQELQGAPALISLPTDHARPAVQDYAGERIEIELDEQLSAAAACVVAPSRHDAAHDAAGRVGGLGGSTVGASGGGDRYAGGQSHAGGSGRADRVFREHAGAAGGGERWRACRGAAGAGTPSQRAGAKPSGCAL